MGILGPIYQYWAGRVYDLCVYFMTGTPKGSTESGFIEKPGTEPATPGLQDMSLSPTPRRHFFIYIPLLSFKKDFVNMQ